MKVFKQNNKLAVYLSPEAAKELGIEENDDVDFFKYSDKAFLFMKKSEVANLLAGITSVPQPVIQRGGDYIGVEEIAVLKKLDTIRYPQRTLEKINDILNAQEKALLQQLIRKKAVNPFKKGNVELYGISKSIYDKFLMRKKPSQGEASPSVQSKPIERMHIEGPYAPLIRSLEERGYLVVQTEAEAGGVSLALEDRIRHGKVLGTRSFNKRFYIVTRQFFDQHNPAIIKAMREGASKVAEIADKARMPEEGSRAILYLLAENGDVRERRKDSFTLA